MTKSCCRQVPWRSHDWRKKSKFSWGEKNLTARCSLLGCGVQCDSDSKLKKCKNILKVRIVDVNQTQHLRKTKALEIKKNKSHWVCLVAVFVETWIWSKTKNLEILKYKSYKSYWVCLEVVLMLFDADAIPPIHYSFSPSWQ